MSIRRALSLLVFFGAGVALGLGPSTGCGDSEACPGTICSDCSASGDCPNLECGAGQSLFCVAYPFGETTSRQRCTFCEDPDYQLP